MTTPMHLTKHMHMYMINSALKQHTNNHFADRLMTKCCFLMAATIQAHVGHVGEQAIHAQFNGLFYSFATNTSQEAHLCVYKINMYN